MHVRSECIPLFFQDSYHASGAMSDLELHGSDKLKADTQEKLEPKDGKMASENISSLQTKLEAAQQQIKMLEEELRTKRDIEESHSQELQQFCEYYSKQDHVFNFL